MGWGGRERTFELVAGLLGVRLLSPDRASQQRPHPQRPPGRHPLLLPLRLSAPPRARRLIARVLDIPTKRCDRAVVSYLVDDESDTLVASPDKHSWCGRRDRALLAVAMQTGLRVSSSLGCATVTSSWAAVLTFAVGKGQNRERPRCAPTW